MSTSLKSERIDIRTTPEAKEALQQAAALAHKNVSEFLLDVGLAAAAETLMDRRAFILPEDKWREFEAALDAPVQHKPRLAKLLSERSILE
jgi:uncharacterized protein (DUF1778 family)